MRVQAATALKEFHQKHDWDAVTNSIDGLDQVLGFFDDMVLIEQHDFQRGSNPPILLR